MMFKNILLTAGLAVVAYGYPLSCDANVPSLFPMSTLNFDTSIVPSIASPLNVAIYPTPQFRISEEKCVILPTTFRMTVTSSFPSHIQAEINQLFPRINKKSSFNVTIATKGQRIARTYSKLVPTQKEGYYLSVTPNGIVLIGNDERGVFYGLNTLKQLINNNSIQQVEIKDYPTIAFRGVVEGFYGQPWSHEARLRQLAFYGANKINTYIYGPKDDPFHSCPNWRKPYPLKEAEQIKQLVEVAHNNEVDFVWAIHPGQDIQWNEEDRNLLLNKFESMYQLGVRSFAVFFDDISGEGTKAKKQAELLNFIDNQFVHIKKDVTPLIMCPTEYNKSWSNIKGGYLPTLGRELNPSIHIMWTGDRVISDITKEGLEWINTHIQRKAYIWWNFPVSDYVRDHLLLGRVYGLDMTIGKNMSGFVSNPMEHAEASKIAIFSVADYSWNPEKYDSNKSWNAAIRAVSPSYADELLLFAEHNSDLGVNGHGYRRVESERIQPTVDTFMRHYKQHILDKISFSALQNEFLRMEEAADALFADDADAPLIVELKPWIEQFRTLSNMGTAVLGMVKAESTNDGMAFLRSYKHVQALQRRWFINDQTYNQNPYQPGVKCGSLVLKPMVDSLFTLATQYYNKTNGTKLAYTVYTSPHQSYSSQRQAHLLPTRVQNNKISLNPLLEVVKWGANEYIGLELEKAVSVNKVEFDLGTKEIPNWVVCEYSTDGVQWMPATTAIRYSTLSGTINGEVRYVRIRNNSTIEQTSYFRKLMVVTK